MALRLCGAFHLPSALVLRVSVHDTYFYLTISLQCLAEFRHFQQTLGVGNHEDSIEASPHPADFLDQLRHINGGSLPDDSAVDTLADKPLTGTSYPADLFVEVGKLSSDRRMMIWLVLLRMDFPFFGPGS